jgi:predicted nucleic acid-binding protein
MEKKLRIYVETSVISHLDAPDRPDRMEETLLLWKEIVAEKYEVVVGDPVILELRKCHEPKRSFMFEKLKKVKYSTIVETEASKQLAAEYINVGGLPGKSWTDATHIALATLAQCDMIVSWNFKHIVNLRAMDVVKRVNAQKNLKSIQIFPPSVFLGGQSDE